MRRVRGASGAAPRALLALAVALLTVVGLFAVHAAAAPLAEAHDHAAASSSAVVPLSALRMSTVSSPAVEPVSASSPAPAREAAPLWPVCPAPVGHGDAGAGCGLGVFKLELFADLAAVPRAVTGSPGAPRALVPTRSRPDRTPSLVELSISRT